MPDAKSIRKDYETTNNNNTPFPFWAKVWPASIGLCNFLSENIEYIADKKVVEVAAGLGLPSLYAAHVASQVICSDYLQQPLDFVNTSIKLNPLKNISTTIIDWNFLPDDFNADVLLLSDINYDPIVFDVLYLMLDKLIQNNTTIILATPQRLIAKSFIEKLEHWCIVKTTQLVNDSWISVFVLEG
jgi:predicted nicotinamide N-methyase